jgi:glycyl-tRNA synthetase alpha subunit
MAHKLANGDYRHHDVRIVRDEYPQSTGAAFGVQWIVRKVGSEINKQKFDTMKEACKAIEDDERK